MMDGAVFPNLTSQLLMRSSLPLSAHRMVPEQERSWDPEGAQPVEDSFPPHGATFFAKGACKVAPASPAALFTGRLRALKP